MDLASPLHNIDISSVNLSLGGGAYSSAASCDADNTITKAAVNNLRSIGIATIASAGNNGFTSLISSPACISSVVSVSSTTKSDVVSSFSNTANFLNLFAPGGFIFSSVPGSYGTKSGTSMSAPHVAGSWAILKSAVPGAPVDDVLNSLKNNGVCITDARNGLSFPRIQVNSALNDLLSIPSADIHDMRTDVFSVNPLTVTQGAIINLQATMTNLGNVDESKARINYRDTTDGMNLFGQRFAINVCGTFVGDVKQWDTAGASIGDHVLKAHVRPTRGFVDENPSNNDIFVTVTIELPSAIHDMKTDAFSVSSLVVTQGDIVDLQATMTNLGNVDESKARINYRDTTDGVNLVGQRFAINAGDTFVGDVKQWDTSTASIGDHVLKAHVRPTAGFVDDDPSNNDIFVTVTVNPPSP